VTFRIIFSRQAKRALDFELPESVAAACAEFIYGPLAANPYRVGKRLREPASVLYSARRGEFRVIYDIRDEEIVVEIIDIRHRRDVYRNLS
jgi:mRNA interferase RelE/StbE